MSPRQSKTGSRSASRARSGKSSGRGGSHSRSLSAGSRGASNARRAASGRGATGNGRRAASARSATSSARRAASGRGAHASRGTAARARRERRSNSSASYAVKLLTQDHRAVAAAIAQFGSAARDEKQAIARRICRMLTVHAQIEEELLYPAARDALRAGDSRLVAEARVEHASIKDLIGQIEDREQLDEQYEAKVRVLGEYVQHHVREEESEIFPRLERTALDLQALGERLEERKRELTGEGARGHDGEGMQEEEGTLAGGMTGARSRGGRGHRHAGLHARRR